MAFSGRFGSILKQNMCKNMAVIGHAPTASMLNAVRYMSAKLFVGGLSYGTTDQGLKDAFASFGEVHEAKVIVDRDTGRSRGFGFVNYYDEEPAKAALSMDGQDLDGRNIRVNFANDRPTASRSGGYSGGYSGGNRSAGSGSYGDEGDSFS